MMTLSKILCGLLALACLCTSTGAIDPGTSLTAFGIHINTASVLQKLESGLYNYNGTFGRLVHFKPGPRECLLADADWAPRRGISYGVSLKACDPHSPHQQWRLVGDQLIVASKQHLPNIESNRQPCFNCWDAHHRADCDLVVVHCINNFDHQQFVLRVHPQQIDLAQKRIYFSIHNKRHPSKCATLFNDGTHVGGRTFRLAECRGTDYQSFWLDIDLSSEIQQIQKTFRDFYRDLTGDSELANVIALKKKCLN